MHFDAESTFQSQRPNEWNLFDVKLLSRDNKHRPTIHHAKCTVYCMALHLRLILDEYAKWFCGCAGWIEKNKLKSNEKKAKQKL